MEMEPKRHLTPLNFLSLSVLSILIGAVAGFGAVLFRALVAFFHNLLFFGAWSLNYDVTAHTPPSPWGPGVILVPVVGAVGVAYLVSRFAPETKGTGIPEVIDAIYYRKGIVSPLKAAVKSVASALSLGSGASVGREGPIIQIGSAFGSAIGQIIPMSAWQRITLVAAGAGGGVAATFNTPVGGMLFATEIMLHEVSVRTLVPVAIASATGAYVGQNFFSAYPAFRIPYFEQFQIQIANPWVLIAYIGLGLITGIASAAGIQAVYRLQDLFDKRIRGNYYTRHMLGMLLVGVMMYLLLRALGKYYIEGVGYATIQDALTNSLSLHVLLLLSVLKLAALSLSLGSGASGGIFSPLLFIGATLGGAYGMLLSRIFPGLPFSGPAFAVAGMAGVIGGSTGAAIAAIIMLFEMTLDYNAIIPMTITVAVSYGIRRIFVEETIYTLKIVRRGRSMPKALQTNFYMLKRARELMRTDFRFVSPSVSPEAFIRFACRESGISHFLLEEGGLILGYLNRATALTACGLEDKHTTLLELAKQDYLIVSEETTIFDVLQAMRPPKAALVLVAGKKGPTSSSPAIAGFITKERIVDSMEEDLAIFTE